MNVSKMEESARTASCLLKSLASEYRLLILCHLAKGELQVTALEERLGIPQPLLSQHLARLRRDGLVRIRRDGRKIFYTIGSLEALRVIGLLYEMFCADEMPARQSFASAVQFAPAMPARPAKELVATRRKAKRKRAPAEV